MNQPRAAVRLAVAMSFLALAALAQGGARRAIPFPTPPATNYVLVTTGNYTKGGGTNALVIDGQNPYLSYAPAYYSTILPMGLGWLVNWADTLRAANPGDTDSVFGIGPAGLTLGQYDQNSVFSWAVKATTGWTDGTKVRVTGDSSGALVAGVQSDHQTVVVGGYSNNAVTGVVSANQGGTVLDLIWVNWGGVMKLAVLTPTALRILSVTLVPEVILPASATTGWIAQLGSDIGWVYPTNGGQNLVVVSAGGSSNPLALALPLSTGLTTAFDVFGIWGGDVNHDGRVDLLIAPTTTSEVVVLFRQASRPLYKNPTSSQEGEVLSYKDDPTLPGSMTGCPLLCDCDNNGCADTVLSAGGSVIVLFQPGGSDGLVPTLPVDCAFSTGDTVGTFKLRFNVPAQGLPSPCYARITVWDALAPLPANSTTPTYANLESTSYANHYHMLMAPSQATQEILLDARTELNNEVWNFNSEQPHLWAQMCFVASTTDGASPLGPSLLFGLTLDNAADGLTTTTSAATLLTMPFMSLLNAAWPVGGPPPQRILHGAQRVLGGIVPVTGLPRTDGDMIYGPLTDGGKATAPSAN